MSFIYDITKSKTMYDSFPMPNRDSGLVHPYLKYLCDLLSANCLRKYKIIVKWSNCGRSWKYQDQVYAQGRTLPGKIVTPCRGGFSMHNYGLAADFYIDGVKGTIYPPHQVQIITAEAKLMGFTCGAFFSTPDPDHLQWTGKLTDKQIEAGKVPVVTDPTYLKLQLNAKYGIAAAGMKP